MSVMADYFTVTVRLQVPGNRLQVTGNRLQVPGNSKVTVRYIESKLGQ